MPRGPGKKENYNLDYSRFNAFDRLDEEQSAAQRGSADADADADAAGGPSTLPPMQEMLQRMPKELQEAYHLMAMSRQTGDPAAQQRASELALRAVQHGSPEVQQEFLQNMAQQVPAMAPTLQQELAAGKDPGKLLEVLQAETIKHATQEVEPKSMEDISSRIDTLRREMEKGQQVARKDMEALQRQQERLERVSSPDDFFAFMRESGLDREDLQRMFAGDEQHMEKRFNEVLQGVAPNSQQPPTQTLDAVSVAEQIHSTICKGKMPEDGVANDSPSKGASESAEVVPAKAAAPKEPQVTVPMYRLQYQKDEQGQYTVVELRCTLPGISDLEVVALDVSERHIRLNTHAPAPRYAVNAGPFPVLIDPSSARAKFSRKREELSVSVSAVGAAAKSS